MSRICRKEEKKIPSKEKKEAKVDKDPDGWFLQKKRIHWFFRSWPLWVGLFVTFIWVIKRSGLGEAGHGALLVPFCCCSKRVTFFLKAKPTRKCSRCFFGWMVSWNMATMVVSCPCQMSEVHVYYFRIEVVGSLSPSIVELAQQTTSMYAVWCFENRDWDSKMFCLFYGTVFCVFLWGTGNMCCVYLEC